MSLCVSFAHSCGHFQVTFELICVIAGIGRLLVGNKSLVILIDHPYIPGKWQHRLDMSFKDISEIITSRGNISSAFITVIVAPKVYSAEDNPFPEIQNLNLTSNRNRTAPKKVRVPALNDDQAKVAGTCFVYEVILGDDSALRSLSDLLRGGPEMPSTSRMHINSAKPTRSYAVQMEGLESALSHDWNGTLPFAVRFQALRIVREGRLSPDSMTALVPEMARFGSQSMKIPEQTCADAVRHLLDGVDSPHPALSAGDYSTKSLIQKLRDAVSSSLKDSSVYRTVKEHSHLALIHHVRVTPCGLYMEGPSPEVCLPVFHGIIS